MAEQTHHTEAKAKESEDTAKPHYSDPILAAVFEGVNGADQAAIAVAAFMDAHGDSITSDERQKIYDHMYSLGVAKPASNS